MDFRHFFIPVIECKLHIKKLQITVSCLFHLGYDTVAGKTAVNRKTVVLTVIIYFETDRAFTYIVLPALLFFL